MSYNDPYSHQYTHQNQPQNHYVDGPEYNPYGGEPQPHATYAQQPYDPYPGTAEGYQDDHARVQSPEPAPFPPQWQSKEGAFAANDM